MMLLQMIARLAAAVLFFAACAAVAYTGLHPAVAFFGVLSAASIAAASKLQRSIQRFIFVDYDEHHTSKRPS